MNDEVKTKPELIPMFSTPVVKTNIGRDFTKDELQLFLIDISMKKDSANHHSKDYYLFDNFPKELGEIHKFCKQQIEWYLKEINSVDTDLASLRIGAGALLLPGVGPGAGISCGYLPAFPELYFPPCRMVAYSVQYLANLDFCRQR